MARSLRLSPREVELVQGLFDGRTEQAMAAGMGISPHTVHTHMERLHHKLEAGHQVALVLRVLAEFLRLAGARRRGVHPICLRRAGGRCHLHL